MNKLVENNIERAINLVLEQDQNEFLELLKDRGRITNYTVRPDGTIDVDDIVNLSNMNLTKIPIKFGVVTGFFVCSHNLLTSLEGCPKKVKGDFHCSHNQLTSLRDAPEKVGGSFHCFVNLITSLEGSPKRVEGDFSCNYNQLTSLEGGPEEVKRDFSCSENQLTSLEGSPEEVGGFFDCSHNQLTTLRGCPRKVGAHFYCEGNPVHFTLKDIELAKQGKAPLGLPLSFVLMKNKEKEFGRRHESNDPIEKALNILIPKKPSGPQRDEYGFSQYSNFDTNEVSYSKTEAKDSIFVFKWKDSDEVVARIRAKSLNQALHKLGLKRGQSWARNAFNTGLIQYDIVTPQGQQVTDAINQLIKGTNYDPGAKKMLKKWQKSLSRFMLVSKEVQEQSEVDYLYHTAPIGALSEILRQQKITPSQKYQKLAMAATFASFTDDLKEIYLKPNRVTLVFDRNTLSSSLEKIKYDRNWFEDNPQVACYVTGRIYDEDEIDDVIEQALEYEHENEWVTKHSNWDVLFELTDIKELLVSDKATQDKVEKITDIPVRVIDSTESVDEEIDLLEAELLNKIKSMTVKGMSIAAIATALTLPIAVVNSAVASNKPGIEQQKSGVEQAITRTMPPNEVNIISDVGKEYKLTGDSLKLLFVIRKIENGRNGLEMGVGDGIKEHPSRRYAGDFNKSLRLQAQWAAGTIRKRFTGDLKKFAERYCPVNSKNWLRMAKSWMGKEEGRGNKK